MPEEDNINAADPGADPGAGENKDGGGVQDPPASEPGSTDAGDGVKEGDKGGDKDQKGKDAKAPPADDNVDDGGKPPVRNQFKTPKDYIIQRKQKKIEKLEGEDKKGEGEEAEDGILPEDKQIISDVVKEQIAPLINQTVDQADETEIKGFLTENPEFKPFEAKARRWIKDPSRQHLPVATVFYEVAGKKLFKIGAERQKAADKAADESQTGGGSVRTPEGGPGVLDISKDDFEKKQEEVRRGQGQK